MGGSSGIIGNPKGTREAPSGSSGLFRIHKGYQKCSEWVNWLIHSYTQRGPKMVQVGRLADSFIYTKRIRDGPSGSSSLFSYTKGTGDGHLAYSCAQRDPTSQKDINVLFSLKNLNILLQSFPVLASQSTN